MSVGWSVGAARLCVVLEAMLRDPVCYCRGMPDLLFCHAMPAAAFRGDEGEGERDRGDGDGDGGGKCFVSEVKR